MPKQYIYQLFSLKHQTPKFSKDTLLCFISKSLKIDCVSFCPILFSNLWKFMVYCCKYELLQVTSVISIFKTYRSCYFSINTGFLIKEKVNKIKQYINVCKFIYIYIYIYICVSCIYIYISCIYIYMHTYMHTSMHTSMHPL